MPISKRQLSYSQSGSGILVTATGQTGSAIHTAYTTTNTTTAPTSWDEVWLYAYNGNSASQTLTLNWGSVTASAQNDTKITINPFSGRQLVVDGRVINSSASIWAYASSASAIVIDGFVNLIS